jgi:two-component system chemotaxis sensor kinase CheA
MDIVHSFVLAHRGRIQIHTEAGKFTRIDLCFPISTAIIDGMVAEIKDLTIILPVSQVVESLHYQRMERYKVGGQIEVIKLRGRVIPVIDLGQFFGKGSSASESCIGVVVEDSFQKPFVLLLDRIVGKREVVVKSLGSRFDSLRSISSGTVLAGGKIGYIIDVEHIIQEAGRPSVPKEVE